MIWEQDAERYGSAACERLSGSVLVAVLTTGVPPAVKQALDTNHREHSASQSCADGGRRSQGSRKGQEKKGHSQREKKARANANQVAKTKTRDRRQKARGETSGDDRTCHVRTAWSLQKTAKRMVSLKFLRIRSIRLACSAQNTFAQSLPSTVTVPSEASTTLRAVTQSQKCSNPGLSFFKSKTIL